jgi:hypothetical protein
VESATCRRKPLVPFDGTLVQVFQLEHVATRACDGDPGGEFDLQLGFDDRGLFRVRVARAAIGEPRPEEGLSGIAMRR